MPRGVRLFSPKLLMIAGVALALGVLGLLVLFFLGDGLFYHPDRHVRSGPGDHGTPIEEVHFAAPNGPKLHGWWMPAQGEAKGTIVYCHGNAANLTLHARYVAWLPAKGYSVLVFDYRGYGKSEGKPTRAGTVADALAAFDFALQRDPERTIAFGHSLGGAIAVTATASRPKIRGVIAESTFANYREIAAASAPLLSMFVPLVISKGFDPDGVLDKVAPRPLFVIHGKDDHIVPVRLGQALFDRASEPKELWLVDGARHFTPWVEKPREFEQRMLQFFDRALAR